MAAFARAPPSGWFRFEVSGAGWPPANAVMKPSPAGSTTVNCIAIAVASAGTPAASRLVNVNVAPPVTRPEASRAAPSRAAEPAGERVSYKRRGESAK